MQPSNLLSYHQGEEDSRRMMQAARTVTLAIGDVTHSFIYSFHNVSYYSSIVPFRRKFSTVYHLVRPLYIYSRLLSHFLMIIQYLLKSSSSSSRHFCPSLYLSNNDAILSQFPRHDMTNPVSLPSLYCM
jgi:hypothetical protein